MAKKKQLNKRIVALLPLVGIVVLAGGAWFVISRLPKDPVKAAEQADKAWANRDYDEAEKQYRIAVGASKNDPEYLFKMGKFQYDMALHAPELTHNQRASHLSAAITALRDAVQRNPSYAEAQAQLCDIFWTIEVPRRVYEQFLREANKYLEIKPNDDLLLFRRATALSDMALTIGGSGGDFGAKAETDFRKAIALRKDRLNYWAGLTNLLDRIQKSEDADKVSMESVKANPDDVDFYHFRADFLRRHKRFEESRQQILTAIKKQPKNPTGHLVMAAFLRMENKLDEALTELDTAKALDAANPRVYAEIATVYYLRGETARSVQVLKEGLEKLQQKFQATTAPTAADRQQNDQARGGLTYQLANTLQDMIEAEKDKDKREALLKEVAQASRELDQLWPGSPHAAKIAGRLALSQGSTPEAMRLLEMAKEGFVFESQTASLLINLYIAQRMPGKAEELLKEFDRADPENSNTQVKLALAKLNLSYRNYTKALRYLAQVLQVEPKNAEALNLKAAIQIAQGTVPTALPKEIELTTPVVEIILDKAALLDVGPQRDQAVLLLENLFQKDKKNPPVISRLIGEYLSRNQADKAKEVLQEAIKANKNNTEIPELVKNLEFQKKLIEEPAAAKRLDMRMAHADEIKDPVRRALEKANIQAVAGDREKYVQFLREAEAVHPETPTPAVINSLLQLALQEQNWTLAQECADKAAKADLDGVNGRLYAAQVALAKNDLSKGIDILTDALKDKPESKDCWTLLGKAQLANKQIPKAEESFRNALKADPGYAEALIGMAQVKELQYKTVEFEELIEQAYRLAPQHPWVKEKYLQIQQPRAKPDELATIIAQRQQMLAQDSNNLPNIYQLGMLYERTQQITKAEELFKTLYERGADKLNLARLLMDFYLRNGRSTEGDQLAQSIIQNWPDKVGAYILYGEFLSRMDIAQAKNAFEKAVACAPATDPRAILALARFYAQQRRWPDAIAAMEKYMEGAPDRKRDPATLKDLARYLLEAERFDDAAKKIAEVLAIDPSDVEARTLDGRMALRKNNPDLAIERFNQAIAFNRNYADALTFRAQAYRLKGDTTKAMSDLEAAASITNNPEICLQLANLYVAMKNYDYAESVLKDVLSRHPEYPFATHDLIALYLERKKWDSLDALIAQGKKLYPKDPTYLMAEATEARLQKNTARQLACYKAALDLSKDSPQILTEYLQALQEAKQYDEMLKLIPQYSSRSGFGWIKSLQATILMQQDKPAEAEKLFREAIVDAMQRHLPLIVRQVELAYGDQACDKLAALAAARPSDFLLSFLVANEYVQAGKVDRAETHFAEAQKLATLPMDRVMILQRVGMGYHRLAGTAGVTGARRLQLLDKALQSYLDVLTMFPNDAHTLNNIAYLYAEDLDQPQKALEYAQKALKLAPGVANIMDTYGWTLARMGRLPEAENNLLRAIDQEDGQQAAYRYHLAWVYEKTGRIKDALKYYKQALDLCAGDQKDPLYESIQKAMARVSPK